MSPRIKFNKKEKILSIKLGKRKSVDSDIQGNVVIDYDKKGAVVGMDIMDINLSDFVPAKQIKSLEIERI